MQKKTNITIKPSGFEQAKTIELTDEDCFQLERGPIVIKHDKLVAIATEEKIGPDEIVCDLATYMSPQNFAFVYRARAKDNMSGFIIEEIGEANPLNCETTISNQYPALMAQKRAVDRLLLRVMGISGDVYSDTEIPFSSPDAKALSGSKSDTGKTGKGSAANKGAEKPADPVEEPKEEKIEEPVKDVPAKTPAKEEPVAETPQEEPAKEEPVEEPVAETPAPEKEVPAASTNTSTLDPEALSMDEYEKNLNEDIALRTPAKFGSHKEDQNFTLKDLIDTDMSSVLWLKGFEVKDKTRDPMRKLKMAVIYLADNNLISLA